MRVQPRPESDAFGAERSGHVAVGFAQADQSRGEEGLFRFEFELESATWRAGEPIVGSARLERLGPGDSISGCGPLGFAFSEIGGSRHMEPEWPACCDRYQLSEGEAITSPLDKSGGIAPDHPDFEFWTAFFESPDVRLPAGMWEIAAVTSFHDGPECGGPEQNLSASLEITVEP